MRAVVLSLALVLGSCEGGSAPATPVMTNPASASPIPQSSSAPAATTTPSALPASPVPMKNPSTAAIDAACRRTWAPGAVRAVDGSPLVGPPTVYPQAFFNELAAILATADPFTLAVGTECVGLAATGTADDPVVLAGVRNTTFGAVLDRTRAGWRDVRAYVGDYPRVLRDAVEHGRRELLIEAGLPGSGGTGSFVAFARGASGWRQIARSDTLGSFFAEILDADHILLTGRKYPVDFPLGFRCNPCIPSNHQELWVRSGDVLTRAATRVVPDPYLSYQVFFGAIRDHRYDRVLYTIADPAAVEDARRFGLDAPEPLVTSARTHEVDDVGRLERRYWWALSDGLNGPAPAATHVTNNVLRYPDLESYGHSVGAREFLVDLERRADGWVVTAVRPAA